MNTLMLTHVVSCLPTARHMSLMCSSGPQGYDAMKEMMNNGMPGRTLLLESGDLYNVYSSEANCCLLYVFNTATEMTILSVRYHQHVPATATHLNVYWDTAVSPPASLLADCDWLTSIALLSAPPCVLSNFLFGCGALQSIDLSPLSNVVAIGSSFLEGCRGLTEVDLSPLSKIQVVSASFLAECTGLTTIDLTPLTNITDVHAFFLAGCTGLTKIDLTPLSRIKELSCSFLVRCSGLTSIDLSPLSQVTEIHEAFLARCTGLKVIDWSPLSSLEYLPYDYEDCGGPETKLVIPRRLEDSEESSSGGDTP